MKGKETAQFQYTRIDFWLPGKGPGLGGGNSWASANFDQGLRVAINGFSIEEEKFFRTHPLFLKDGSKSLGTWIEDDGYAKTCTTIYQLGDRWLHHLQFTGGANREPIEMHELTTKKGRLFSMKGSTDRYLIGSDGDLEIHNSAGKVVSRRARIIPPPPDR